MLHYLLNHFKAIYEIDYNDSFTVCAKYRIFAGSISGTIKDSETNEALSGAIIRIKNTSIGMKADNKGNFLLENLSNGIYTIRITYIGYTASEHIITISDKQPDQSMVVNLLPKSLNASEIVVSAGKEVNQFKKFLFLFPY